MPANATAKHKDLAEDERCAFSQRLKDSLSAVGIAHSPTVLGRQYNMRTPTNRVSIHAVRKWLTGESLPNQVRLQALASMLGTSANWLRFGDSESEAKWSRLSERVDAEIALMVHDVQRLDTASRGLLDALVAEMLTVQEAKGRQ